MQKIGLDLPKSAFDYNLDEAWQIAREIGFPLIIRPSFTLGGTGGSIVYSESDFERAAQYGLNCSRINEILIEESVIGWKEYELEIMRDKADNVVIICSTKILIQWEFIPETVSLAHQHLPLLIVSIKNA